MVTGVQISAIIGGMMLFGMVGIALGAMSAWNERRLTHTERMKALEMGHPLPDDPEVAKIKARTAAKNQYVTGEPIPENIRLARACYKTASVVAFLGFGAIIPCSFFGGTGVAVALAMATAAIGVTSVVCGTYLVTHGVASPELRAKSQMDPDAFDVAGRRG